MFNTMNVLKAAGALLGAFLFLLVANTASNALFTIGDSAHGEAEGEHAEVAMMTAAPGGLLDAGGGDEAAAEEEVVVALDGGDAAKGEKVFGKCKACHKVDGTNGTGPHLDGVVDRAVASAAGFGYSDAMVAHGGTWTLEALDAWLAKPKDYIPGNKMSFAGLPKAEDRADLIAYLRSFGG